MPKAAPLYSAFNAGWLSKYADGRADLDKYAMGCSDMDNFIPTILGPAVRRGGTYFLAEVKDSTDRCWLLRFMYSATEAYVIEVGDLYIRIYTDRARLELSSVTAWSNATAYTVGDLASRAGVNYYCIADHTNQQPPNSTYWYPLTSDILEIPSPWTAADLTGDDGECLLRYSQVGDIVYIANAGGNYPLYKLSRYSATKWTLAKVTLSGGPFKDVNTSSTTVYASAATGAGITLTASSSIFQSGHIGSLFYLGRKSVDDTKQWEVAKSISTNDLRRSFGIIYKALNSATTGTIKPIHQEGAAYDGDTGVQWEYQNPGYGWVTITAVASGTSATATVVSQIPAGAVGSGNASTNWAHALFSDAEGWPEHVCFFRNRLSLARAQTLAFSVVDDYEVFTARDRSGLLAEDMAIVAAIGADTANRIAWIAPTSNGLLIGTASGEMVCQEISQADVFWANNIAINPQTSFGSRGIQPAKYKDAVVFVQRSGRRVRQLGYSWDVNGFRASDLSVLNPEACVPGIVDMVYAQEPWSSVWMARSDGRLIGLTLEADQNVNGFHPHSVGGVVEAVQTIPSPDNDRDDLYLIVKRTINGSTKRYVEVLWPEYQEGDAKEDSFYVDCGLTYDSTPTTTITGLGHLEGKEVAILADGAPQPAKTVTSGSITLDISASVVHVGLKQTAYLKTMRINAGAADGTAQGKRKRILDVVVRLLNTLGGRVGPSTTKNDEIQFRTSSMPMNQSPDLYTGDKGPIPWPNGSETDGYVTYINDQPLPATVVAIMPRVDTQDRG